MNFYCYSMRRGEKGKCLKTKVLDESPASLSASRMTRRLLLLSSGGTTTLIFLVFWKGGEYNKTEII